MAAERRRRRKEARPGEILDAGLAAFAENGFAATRLDDVARRAGISKGTIYLYFDSKEALFEAAIRDRLATVITDVADTATAFDGPTEALLETLLGRIYDTVVDTDAAVVLKVLIAEGQRFPDLVALYHDLVLSGGMALLRRIVDRGIARGEVRDSAVARDPRVIVAPAIAAAIWRLLFDSRAPLDRRTFLAAHLDMLKGGLLVR